MSINTQSGLFDEDYFENGIQTGKSCYSNYRWLPELTMNMAKVIVKCLSLHSSDRVLDYGCSKGYLVKALRKMDIDAYGCDLSSYAILNCDSEVSSFCRLITESDPLPYDDDFFDYIITKDVLEHIPVTYLSELILLATKKTKRMFHIIPLGNDDGSFVISQYANDPTHVTIKTEDWWKGFFSNNGWVVESFSYCVPGIKDNWHEFDQKGNGFFVLSRA